MDKPEVLVHISTSATRANDDLYRSLADAYLAFESHQPDKGAVDTKALPEIINVQSNHRSSSQGEASNLDVVAAVLTSVDSYGSFPSHIGSEDRYSDHNSSENYEEPLSPEDVSISRLEWLERIQSRWREQRTPRSSLANNRRNSDSTLILPPGESTFIENTQQALQAMESQLSYDLSTDLSATSEEASDNDMDETVNKDINQSIAEGTEIEISRTPFMPSSGNIQAESHLDAPLDSEQPFPRKSLSMVAVEKEQQPPLSQHSILSLDTKNNESSQASRSEDRAHQVDFESLLSIVCPPPPKITIESPGTLPSQVTPYLAKLKQQNTGRFKPKMPLRALEADERGHWRVDCRLWPKHAQHQFWNFLQADIESGRLGWGVTLHREAVRMRLGLVRLYCWGETVEHVWVALWLHSGGRVWSTGAAWMDGAEVQIVSIP